MNFRTPDDRHNRAAFRTPRAAFLKRRQKRSGAIYLELILALPALFLVTLAIFEFGILMIVEQTAINAAIEGAREAAKVNATTNNIAFAVKRILKTDKITLSATGTNITDGAMLKIEGGTAAGMRGNTSLNCSPRGPKPLNAGEIRVTVCVQITNGQNHPVPNWLRRFGPSFTNRTFDVSALALQE